VSVIKDERSVKLTKVIDLRGKLLTMNVRQSGASMEARRSGCRSQSPFWTTNHAENVFMPGIVGVSGMSWYIGGVGDVMNLVWCKGAADSPNEGLRQLYQWKCRLLGYEIMKRLSYLDQG